jgi:hypothetical protein
MHHITQCRGPVAETAAVSQFIAGVTAQVRQPIGTSRIGNATKGIESRLLGGR